VHARKHHTPETFGSVHARKHHTPETFGPVHARKHHAPETFGPDHARKHLYDPAERAATCAAYDCRADLHIFRAGEAILRLKMACFS
jgi:hypothetical protein